MSAAIASIGFFRGKLLVLLVAGSYNYVINTLSVVLAVYFVLGLEKKILFFTALFFEYLTNAPMHLSIQSKPVHVLPCY